MSTVSGQDALASKEKGLQKMDGYKKWNKPQGGKKQAPEDVDVTIHLSNSGRKILREFIENFIDSGFNPLFHHIRKDIDREADRFVSVHIKVFFYLVAWLLEAERMRRSAALKDDPQEVPESFEIIAAVMNQETLILIQRHMRQWWENKMWPELESVMKCFTQIVSRHPPIVNRQIFTNPPYSYSQSKIWQCPRSKKIKILPRISRAEYSTRKAHSTLCIPFFEATQHRHLDT